MIADECADELSMLRDPLGSLTCRSSRAPLSSHPKSGTVPERKPKLDHVPPKNARTHTHTHTLQRFAVVSSLRFACVFPFAWCACWCEVGRGVYHQNWFEVGREVGDRQERLGRVVDIEKACWKVRPFTQ